MATVDEYLHPVDIKRTHVLTRTIERMVEEAAVFDVPFCRIQQTRFRKLKLNIRAFDPSGLGAFKADNANTPVVKGGGDVTEQYIELVTLSEKHPLTASDLIALESPDISVSEGAARDVLKLGAQLRQRNVQRTKWMAWQSAKDALTITYPDGGAITVDWDFDGSGLNSDFSGTHLPTAAAGWDVAATDIITDVYNWTKLIEDDLGVESGECIMHMNKATWRYLKSNTGLKAELSAQNPRIITPRMNEVVEILEIAEIKIVNDFYKLETSQTTKYRYVPDGYVLFTAPYVVNGVPIMEMFDGPVVLVRGQDLVVASNPGAQSEIYNNLETTQQNIRVTTARMPMVNYPAAFVYANVY